MSLIPISSLANGTIYTTAPFVGPQNPTGTRFMTPAAGETVHVYAHGTTTPAAVYLDEAGTQPATQPLTTGVDGAVPGFIDPATLPLDLVVGGETYELAGASGGSGAVASVNSQTGAVVLTAADVGADAAGAAAAEQTRAEAAEALLAPLASPALTGTPTAPTQASGDASTAIATTAFAADAILRNKHLSYDFTSPEFGGADGSGHWDTAINAAASALSAAGGGVLTAAPGTYNLGAAITPADGVSFVMPGVKLVATGNFSPLTLQRTSSTPLTGCVFDGFTVDGAAQTTLSKGIFIQYLKNCHFRNLTVQNCYATGLGIDFLYDCSITDCYLYNNGRGYTPGTAGCAGIGIGSGGSGAVEAFTIHGNHCEGNGSYGIFVEAQIATAFVQAVVIANNTCRGSQKGGIGVSGGEGTTVIGNVCDGNGTAGTSTHTANIVLDLGTLNRGNPTYWVIEGNVCSNGLAHGILVYGNSTAAKAACRGRISDNVVYFNGSTTSGQDGHGILLDGSQHAFIDVTVSDNTVALNEADGIHFASGSGHTNIVFRDNDVYGNGRAGGTADGINVSGNLSVTGLQIVGNQCYEASSHQTNGINLTSGSTITQGHVAGNDVRGNATAGLLVNATLVSTEIRANPGYNPVGVETVAVPATGVAVAAAAHDRTFYVTAGASTCTMAIQGGASPVIPSGAFATIRVPAGKTVTPTYTSAPTWVVEGE